MLLQAPCLLVVFVQIWSHLFNVVTCFYFFFGGGHFLLFRLEIFWRWPSEAETFLRLVFVPQRFFLGEKWWNFLLFRLWARLVADFWLASGSFIPPVLSVLLN